MLAVFRQSTGQINRWSDRPTDGLDDKTCTSIHLCFINDSDAANDNLLKDSSDSACLCVFKIKVQ